MREDFRNRLLNRYEEDPLWKKIGKALNRSAEDGTSLPLSRENGLIFRKEGASAAHAFEPRGLCLPSGMTKEIFAITHDETVLRDATKR